MRPPLLHRTAHDVRRRGCPARATKPRTVLPRRAAHVHAPPHARRRCVVVCRWCMLLRRRGESLSGRVRVRLFRCQAKRGGVEVCTSVGRPADTHAWLAASCFVVRNDSRERSWCAVVVVAPPLHFVGRSTRLRARRADEALSLSVGCSYELGKYHGTLSRGLDSHGGGRRGQCVFFLFRRASRRCGAKSTSACNVPERRASAVVMGLVCLLAQNRWSSWAG